MLYIYVIHVGSAIFFFFFKQKTAYEMRISDWSSDVCSSDLQFHPEVVHTPDGGKLLKNFVRHVCGLAGDWTMAEFRKTKIAEIREQVGDKRDRKSVV